MKPLNQLFSAWERSKQRLVLLQDIEADRLNAIWKRLEPVVREHREIIGKMMLDHGDAHRYDNTFGHFGRTGWLSDIRLCGEVLELDQSYSCRGSSGIETIRLPRGYLEDPVAQLQSDCERYRAEYAARREHDDRARYAELKARFESK